MKKRILKRTISCLLISGLSLNIMTFAFPAFASNGTKALSIKDVKNQKKFKDLRSDQKKEINSLKKAAQIDGLHAAEMLNKEINPHDENYAIAIKEILDMFFSSDDLDKENIEAFKIGLNSDISEQLKQYQEAWKERNMSASKRGYEAGEIIVSFSKETKNSEIETFVANMSDSFEIIVDNREENYSNLDLSEVQDMLGHENDVFVEVNLDLDQTVRQAINEFEKYQEVTSAEKATYTVSYENGEIVSESSLVTSGKDPNTSEQWYLDRCEFGSAWDYLEGKGNSSVEIAVVDNGFDINCIDLAGVIDKNYSVDVTNTCDSSVKENGYMLLAKGKANKTYVSGDDLNHGTMCASIIGAKVNGLYITGASQQSNSTKLQLVKDGNSTTGEILTSDLAKSISYIVQTSNDTGVKIISCSQNSESDEDVLKAACLKASNNDILIISSAGNNNSSVASYPAAYSKVLSVGATGNYNSILGTYDNKRARWGSGMASNYGSYVNIAAPGTDVCAIGVNNKIRYGNGTSFSTPLVAASAALILSIKGNISSTNIYKILQATSKETGCESADNNGHGWIEGSPYTDYCFLGEGSILYTYECSKCGAYKEECPRNHTFYRDSVWTAGLMNCNAAVRTAYLYY